MLNPAILFDLSQSLRRHRKLVGMSLDCLVNKTQYRLVYAKVGYALNNLTSISHAIENVIIGVARCLHLLNTADKCPISVVPGWLGPWYVCSLLSRAMGPFTDF